jgi:hypothetical protein
MAVSNVAICNLALQKLGASRITSLTENSANARSCNACYELIRDAEIRRYAWNFAKTRTTLAPDAETPDFDFDYAFTLPPDCLRVLPPSRNDLDWSIESGKILTNDGDTLEIIYLKRVEDEALFDPAFVEAFACKLAWHMCEEITQSNQKKADILTEYKDVIKEAKRANSFERIADEPPEDTWITARR